MPPKTRAKKRKNEAQAVQAAGQQDQQLNQSGSQPRKQEVKKRGKPRAKGQAKAQATKQRKQSLGKKATPNNQGAAVENQKPPQEGPTSTRQSRESRTGTWHPRRRSGNPQDHTSLQHVRSRIRKKSIPQRQGFKLPRFDVPYWKIRAGVPTMVLRLLASGTETDAANVHQDDAEEMEIDSESYEDVPSGDDKRDAPPKGPPPQIDPPPPQEGPTPRPSPPSVRQLGDRADFPIHVDSQARTPPPTDFPKYPEDSPEYDVAPLTFPNMGFAGEEEIEKWGSRMARFIHSPASDLDLDTVGWHGIKPLGKGSFGMAGLWERKDIDGEVIDEMVVKQIGKEPGKPWQPEVPMEVGCMQMLNDYSTAGESVVEFRDYRRYPRREVHRIYMEYCPYGDLDKLIKEYRTRKHFIPEKFIWEAFYYLARACKGLEDLIPDHKRTPDYSVAVHQDIKPCNVFLGNHPVNWDDGWNPAYPMVKLGDFGTAILTGAKDMDNPLRYRGTGSYGYRALEQENLPSAQAWDYDERALDRLRHYQKHESSGGRPSQILSHTNVWTIGATIFELMSLKEVLYYIYDYEDYPKDGAEEGEGETYLEGVTRDALYEVDLFSHYSQDLISIMRECLRPNPATRPRVDQLVREIRESRSGWVGLDDEENMPEKDRIPFGNFESLEEGKWRPDPDQQYAPLMGDRFSRSSLKAMVAKKETPLPDNQEDHQDDQQDNDGEDDGEDDGQNDGGDNGREG